MSDTMVKAPPSLFIERCSDSGELIGIVQLDEEYFGALVNVPLLHQVVNAQLAAKRSGTHSTKTRAEVAGGGAKPYRQKGTGRARQGTTRAPQFTGGGIAFGPKPRDYTQATPRKMVRQALRAALSDRAFEGRVVLVDRWSYEVPKTKQALASLRALGIDGNVLLVLGSQDVIAERSFANIPLINIVESAQLTAYDVVVSDWVVFTDETVPGQTSDAPEDAVAFSSARPVVLEDDEAVLEDDDEAVLEDDDEAVLEDELEAVAEDEVVAEDLDEEPADPVLAELVVAEPADEAPVEQADDSAVAEQEAPKPKARTRARKAPAKATPAEGDQGEEGK
ncbi:MAG: 50S ribosomal protein L4 [Acidimicrobiales bacterium]|jgi:large subunit ribosomal protein L4